MYNFTHVRVLRIKFAILQITVPASQAKSLTFGLSSTLVQSADAFSEVRIFGPVSQAPNCCVPINKR